MHKYLIILPLLISGAVYGQQISEIKTDGLSFNEGSSVKFEITFNGQGRCGLQFIFGDGSTSDFRVEDASKPIVAIKSYPAKGAYKIEATGKTLIRGLNSFSPCKGNAKIEIAVGQNSDVPQKSDNSTNVVKGAPQNSSDQIMAEAARAIAAEAERKKAAVAPSKSDQQPVPVQAPNPATTQKIESHCSKSEFVILTAKMGKMEKDKFIPNGKYLSLCSDAKKEPFNRLAYRYGTIGAVELEVAATPTSKFNLHHEMTGPRMSDNVVWFSRGNTTYLINEAMGMTQGVSLYVYQGKKKIAEITSGLDNDNYDSDLGSVDMSKSQSPVFVIKGHAITFY